MANNQKPAYRIGQRYRSKNPNIASLGYYEIVRIVDSRVTIKFVTNNNETLWVDNFGLHILTLFKPESQDTSQYLIPELANEI